MTPLAQQIKDLEATRAAKVARMNEVTNKSIEAGRSMDEAEAQEFDEIRDEVKQIDADLSRLHDLETLSAGSAQPVNHGQQQRSADQVIERTAKGGAPAIIKTQDKDDDFEGQKWTRLVIARTLAKMDGRSMAQIAEERWGKSAPNMVSVIKADVAGGGSGSSEWGNELVSTDSWMGDFQEYLYATTVYNQLPLREVPANITIKGQDGQGTGYWVGESKAIPVSALDFNDVTLTPLKVAALSVISKELIRDSSPSAEKLVRDALAEACRQRIDNTFISNSAAVASVSPAGIMYNIPGTLSAGNDGDSVLNDIKELRQRFINANNGGGITYVMSKSLANSLSLLRNALDQREFPTVTEEGGTLEGRPVVTGDNVNANYFIAVKPSDIYRIGMGQMELSISEHASIEMADDPGQDSDTPTAATGKVVNMFQTESMAIKCLQSINFARRRESAVSWIKDADYGGSVST